MSVFISHPATVEDRPEGTCPLGAEGAREGGRAVGVALRMERYRDPIRTASQLRQLEEDVACRFTLAHGAGEPAGARRASDLHVVRESFGSADEERTGQLE